MKRETVIKLTLIAVMVLLIIYIKSNISSNNDSLEAISDSVTDEIIKSPELAAVFGLGEDGAVFI